MGNDDSRSRTHAAKTFVAKGTRETFSRDGARWIAELQQMSLLFKFCCPTHSMLVVSQFVRVRDAFTGTSIFTAVAMPS